MGISGRHVEFYGVPDRCTGIVDSGTSSLEAYLVSRNNWSSFCNIITRLTLAYSPLSVFLPSKGWFCPKMSSRKSWSLWIRRLVLIDHTNKPGIKMHLHIRNIQKSISRDSSFHLGNTSLTCASKTIWRGCQILAAPELMLVAVTASSQGVLKFLEWKIPLICIYNVSNCVMWRRLGLVSMLLHISYSFHMHLTCAACRSLAQWRLELDLFPDLIVRLASAPCCNKLDNLSDLSCKQTLLSMIVDVDVNSSRLCFWIGYFRSFKAHTCHLQWTQILWAEAHESQSLDLRIPPSTYFQHGA